jgi:hypothetical protein
MANKTRYEVQRILRSVTLSGLEDLGYSGWNVVEFANPEFINFDKVVTLQLMRERRVGWQGFSYGVTDNASRLDRKDEWLSEQHWQLQLLMKRPRNPTADTPMAEDIADSLVAWFNGVGMAKLREGGVAPLRIDGTTIFVYNDNSDLYQKRAVFTVKIQVPKELVYGENALEVIKPDIKPV